MAPRDLQQNRSPAVLRRATALLRATRDALAERERWSQGAWARDESGESLGDLIWDAARSPRARSRELLAELLVQAWNRGYAVQLDAPRLMLSGIHRAPASVWVAVQALADSCLDVFPLDEPDSERLVQLRRSIAVRPLPERAVLAPSALNDLGGHQDVIDALDRAIGTLAAELARRKKDAR